MLIRAPNMPFWHVDKSKTQCCRAVHFKHCLEKGFSNLSITHLDKKINKSFLFWHHGGFTVKSKILSICKLRKTILIRFISLMEMETLQIWSDSEAVVATCSLGINKPVADYHLLAISASEYLLNFSPSVNICQRRSIWLALSWDTLLQHADT